MAIAPGTPPHSLVAALGQRAVGPALVNAANASPAAQRARLAATPDPNELLAALRALAASRAQAPGQQYEGPVSEAAPQGFVPEPVGLHPGAQLEGGSSTPMAALPRAVPAPPDHGPMVNAIRSALLHAFLTGELARGKAAR